MNQEQTCMQYSSIPNTLSLNCSLFNQVSWLVEFSILFSMFGLHFVIGKDNRAEQNAAASIFGFMFPSMNLLIFPLVQGYKLLSQIYN